MKVERELSDKKRVRFFSYFLVFLVLSVGGYAATQSSFLDVDYIDLVITGGDTLTREEVLEITGLAVSQPMLSVDKNTFIDSIEIDPRVKSAVITKDWPNKVKVEVTLRTPFVNGLTLEGEFLLLDETGNVLENLANKQNDFPTILIQKIEIPGNSVSGIELLIEAAKAVDQDMFDWIKILRPASSGVRAELYGGVNVNLGPGPDYLDEIRDLKAVLARVELSCVKSVDVSVKENPIVIRDNSRC